MFHEGQCQVNSIRTIQMISFFSKFLSQVQTVQYQNSSYVLISLQALTNSDSNPFSFLFSLAISTASYELKFFMTFFYLELISSF